MSTNPAAIVVTHAFGTYARGDLITDAAAIEKIMSEGRGHMYVPVAAPAAREPAETPTATQPEH